MTSNGPLLDSLPTQDLLTFLFPEDDARREQVVWQDVKYPTETITKSQALSLVRRLSHAYVSKGILDPSGKDNHVITVTENQPLGFVHVLAIIASGGVGATCPWQASASEILFRVDMLKPKAVVCSKATVNTVMACRKQAQQGFRVICHDSQSMTVCDEDGTSMFSQRERAWSTEWNEIIAVSPAAIVFSSGTTGSPKGVCISQRNIIAMICQLRQLWAPILHQTKPTLMLGSLDNAHVAGLFLNTFCGLGVGLGTILAPASDIDLVMQAFRQHPIAVFPTVPAVLQRILASPSFHADLFKHLRYTGTGAAKTPDEVKAAFSQALSPGVFCQEAWGMTELTFLATMHAPGVCGPWNSIGKPLAGNTIEIRDASQQKVAANCEGEVYISGPTVTPGYLRASAVEQATSHSDWFRTGDIGWVDPEGYVYVTGRNKELIKYNGTQIAPAELENLCRTLSYVLDAAVVGVELDDGNELPAAFIVLADNAPEATKAVQEVATTVNRQVSPYKKLRGGVYATKAIPRNAMGKPLLVELKGMAKTRYGTRREKCCEYASAVCCRMQP